jgi:hypothetical protein
MKNTHCRTWDKARKLKNVENEAQTLYGLEYGQKPTLEDLEYGEKI